MTLQNNLQNKLKNKLGITNSAALARVEEKISKTKALELFETGLLDTFEVGTFDGLVSSILKYIYIYVILFNMDKYISIGEASKILGVSISTLRRWEREGKISSIRTSGNQRRYNAYTLSPNRTRKLSDSRATVAYARVSSHAKRMIWSVKSRY